MICGPAAYCVGEEAEPTWPGFPHSWWQSQGGPPLWLHADSGLCPHGGFSQLCWAHGDTVTWTCVTLHVKPMDTEQVTGCPVPESWHRHEDIPCTARWTRCWGEGRGWAPFLVPAPFCLSKYSQFPLAPTNIFVT